MELAAPTPPDAGAPSHAPGNFAGAEVPAAYDMRGGKAPSALPYAGALRPSTPGDFLPDEKVTKESPRGGTPSGYSPEGDRAKSVSLFAPAPPAASRTPSIGLSATKIDRFATLRQWANRSCFFPLVPSRKHFLLSIRGAVGALLPRMLKGLSYLEQYR